MKIELTWEEFTIIIDKVWKNYNEWTKLGPEFDYFPIKIFFEEFEEQYKKLKGGAND